MLRPEQCSVLRKWRSASHKPLAYVQCLRDFSNESSPKHKGQANSWATRNASDLAKRISLTGGLDLQEKKIDAISSQLPEPQPVVLNRSLTRTRAIVAGWPCLR